MRGKGNWIYTYICILICILPFAGLPFWKTETSRENRRLAAKPVLRENGVWNRTYFQEWEQWFEDHFAFRDVFVTADSLVQVKVFGVSPIDTVVVGKDGWLFYASSLDDYTGNGALTGRGIWNAVHNLSLMQRYAEERGAEFLLTVPPNKNTLYGDHMPDCYQKRTGQSNLERMATELQKLGMPYADLMEGFQAQKDILYLKRDSHWSGRGAVLAYNIMLDALQVEHDRYDTVESIRKKDSYGDLNGMLYPLPVEPEWDEEFQKELSYHYVTDTESVEDPWIVTENGEAEGSVLMFRDSFGNTLLPLIADSFGQAYFSKSTPYRIAEYMDQCEPDHVVVEKVERNLKEFAKEPPVMPGIEIPVTDALESSLAEASGEEEMETGEGLVVSESEYDSNYWKISGVLEHSEESDVLICVARNGNTRMYEPFTVTSEETDYGYLLYLPEKELASGTVELSLVLKEREGFRVIEHKKVDLYSQPGLSVED